jgi:hypothetical protein
MVPSKQTAKDGSTMEVIISLPLRLTCHWNASRYNLSHHCYMIEPYFQMDRLWRRDNEQISTWISQPYESSMQCFW